MVGAIIGAVVAGVVLLLGLFGYVDNARRRRAMFEDLAAVEDRNAERLQEALLEEQKKDRQKNEEVMNDAKNLAKSSRLADMLKRYIRNGS